MKKLKDIFGKKGAQSASEKRTVQIPFTFKRTAFLDSIAMITITIDAEKEKTDEEVQCDLAYRMQEIACVPHNTVEEVMQEFAAANPCSYKISSTWSVYSGTIQW